MNVKKENYSSSRRKERRLCSLGGCGFAEFDLSPFHLLESLKESSNSAPICANPFVH